VKEPKKKRRLRARFRQLVRRTKTSRAAVPPWQALLFEAGIA
jgi:hypothetical protein